MDVEQDKKPGSDAVNNGECAVYFYSDALCDERYLSHQRRNARVEQALQRAPALAGKLRPI